jgi:hypothetical protein
MANPYVFKNGSTPIQFMSGEYLMKPYTRINKIFLIMAFKIEKDQDDTKLCIKTRIYDMSLLMRLITACIFLAQMSSYDGSKWQFITVGVYIGTSISYFGRYLNTIYKMVNTTDLYISYENFNNNQITYLFELFIALPFYIKTFVECQSNDKNANMCSDIEISMIFLIFEYMFTLVYFYFFVHDSRIETRRHMFHDIVKEDDEECPICCLVDNDNQWCQTECHHKFHLECIDSQLITCCPICRLSFLNHVHITQV